MCVKKTRKTRRCVPLKTINIDFTDSTVGNLGRAGEHNNTKIIFALSPELAKCDFLTAEVSTAAGEKTPIEGICDEENSTFAIFLTNQLTVEGAISLQLVGYVTESETAEPQIIAKSPVVNGFITQGINGVETEADSNPNLLARIWAKVREWADKIHTHDNKKTLDQLYCKAVEDMFSQGDDEGYLTFRGDKLRPISDGVVIKEVEEIEKDGAKFLHLLLNKGGGLSNNWLPDFIDIPVNAVKEVKEENPGFDFTLNGSELELPTGSGSVGLTKAQIKALDEMFKIASYTENPTTAYKTFREAFELDEVVKMTSISAMYIGGDVMEGLALHKLTGITVTGNYSDGTTEEIIDYTLSGVIGEGASTITVTYEDLTTTFEVTGIPIETLYQEVEYIEFDGQSFIDPNEPASNNCEFDVTASFPQATGERILLSLSTESQAPVCIEHSTTPNRMFLFCHTSAAIYNIENLYNSVVYAHGIYKHGTGKTFTVEADGKKYTTTNTDTVDVSDAKFVIGTAGYASARYAFIGKLYHVSYIADDVLVCDFIPCYRKADNEVGLYNKVNGMFYANSGTGTLTAGGNV